jgi:Flp pilus assembly protein TadD
MGTGPRAVRRLEPGACKAASTITILAGALMLGACAQTGSAPTLDALADASTAPKAQRTAQSSGDKTATDYWARKYADAPTDLEAALGYARNLKAAGRKKEAYDVLQQAAMFHPSDRMLASEYGRLALDLDQLNVAARVLQAADDPSNPDWKVLSARGTVLARQGKYSDAIPLYQRALALAPDRASVMNNLGLAYAMTGDAAKAEPLLRRAVAADGGMPRTRQNLALVVGLQGKYDDAKQIAMRDIGAEGAASDADYLRRMVSADNPPAAPAKAAPAKAAPAPKTLASAPALKPATYESGIGAAAVGSWTSEVAQRTGTQ